MIRQLATSMILIGAIAPYKTPITNNNTTTINLATNNNWTIAVNNATIFAKNQITKTFYENEVIKIEQIKLVEFRQDESEENQEITGYLFTRVTPKIEFTSFSYQNNGYYQTYTDALSINTVSSTYRWDVYTVNQIPENEDDFDLLFALNTWNYTTIWAAEDRAEAGTQAANMTSIEAIANFGRTGYQQNIENNTKVFMDKIYTQNLYDPNVQGFEDLIVWNKNYAFFYGQPYETNFTYTWTINPETVDGYEVVDVQGLLLTILGMPMAWITQAFNFTLWPGTQFALNVGHILSAVIIASVIIIIIKKVYK